MVDKKAAGFHKMWTKQKNNGILYIRNVENKGDLGI